jgi:hypothetical protein
MLLKDIPRDRRTAYILTGVVFTLAGVINLVRGIYVFALAPIAGLFDQTISNGLLFLVASMGVVSWSLGFIVLTADGLAEDTKEKPIGRFGSNGATKTGIQRVQRGTVSEEEVRQQLARIVDSNMFRRSTQMVRFLTIIVERSLSGRPEDLKEYVLGRDAFHRGEDYDPRTDSIVRVEAQRLRRKLREYYDSKDRRDTILIELPAGSYVPVFKYLQPRINDQLRLRASAD